MRILYCGTGKIEDFWLTPPYIWAKYDYLTLGEHLDLCNVPYQLLIREYERSIEAFRFPDQEILGYFEI
jgi:hypothetical protein